MARPGDQNRTEGAGSAADNSRARAKPSVSWPPGGWPLFTPITQTSARALEADSETGIMRGAAFTVEGRPSSEGRACEYHIRVVLWFYDVQSGPAEVPLLELCLTDRHDAGAADEDCISNVRIMSKKIPHEPDMARQSLSAAALMMAQIQGGAVPDGEKILRMKRLLPYFSRWSTGRI